MGYICVRTYGNGYYMSKLFPQIFKNYEKALDKCNELNETDVDDEDCSEKWIVFGIYMDD